MSLTWRFHSQSEWVGLRRGREKTLRPCLNPNDLVDFLRGHLGNEESLAVDRHVDDCSKCRVLLLEIAKLETRGPELNQPRSPRDPWGRGAVIDRYVVLDRVGAGTMGVVYSAYDPKLDRKVAIKVLRARSPSSEVCEEAPVLTRSAADMRARLQREAQALARLTHPNVLSVYDIGTFKDDVFIVMEFVEGSTLRQWLALSERHWKEVMAVLVPAGEGLAAAHAAGLVHRDFKPDNVMVGKDGRVRVMDFGLATAVHASDEANPIGETHSRALAGTPAYMAPEQLAADAADARSDQFSFCATLYESLYGRLPLDGAAQGRAEETTRKGRPPSQIRRIVLKGLSASASNRYASMEVLLATLKARPAALRHRMMAVAVVGLVVSSAAIYRQVSRKHQLLCKGADQKLTGIWDAKRGALVHASFTSTKNADAENAFVGVEKALTSYAAKWASMHVEACEATRIRGEQSEEMLDRRMSCLSEKLNELKALVEVFQGADAKTVERAVEAANGLSSLGSCADLPALGSRLSPPQDEGMRTKIEQQRKGLAFVKALALSGRYREALEAAHRAHELAQALGYIPLEAEAAFYLGEAQTRNSLYREAESSLTDSVMLAEASHHDEFAARASILLVHVTGNGLRKQDAAQFWERHGNSAIQRIGGSDELKATLAYMRASVLAVASKNEEALEALQEAIKLLERLYGPESYRLSSPLQGMGIVLAHMGRLQEAEVSLLRALAIAEKSAGPDTPAVGSIKMSLGEVLSARGDFAQQAELVQRTLPILEKTLHPKHVAIAIALQHLGFAYAELGQARKAVECSAKALQLAAETKGSHNPDLEVFHNIYGHALLSAGDFVQALDQYQQALAIQETVNQQAPNFAADLTGIGQAWLGLHHPSKALPLLERAFRLEIATKHPPLGIATTQFALARALWETRRDRVRARELAMAARDTWMKNGLNPKRVTEIDEWMATRAIRPDAATPGLALEKRN